MSEKCVFGKKLWESMCWGMEFKMTKKEIGQWNKMLLSWIIEIKLTLPGISCPFGLFHRFGRLLRCLRRTPSYLFTHAFIWIRHLVPWGKFSDFKNVAVNAFVITLLRTMSRVKCHRQLCLAYSVLWPAHDNKQNSSINESQTTAGWDKKSWKQRFNSIFIRRTGNSFSRLSNFLSSRVFKASVNVVIQWVPCVLSVFRPDWVSTETVLSSRKKEPLGSKFIRST